MRAALAWPEERLRRAQRDLKAHRRRSLERRIHVRFKRDLRIVPHLFLARESLRVAELRAPKNEILAALAGHAVWTLDTAARLAGLRGFLTAGDLTGYLDESALRRLADNGLIGEPAPGFVSVDPIFARAPLLIIRLDATPPSVTLPAGHRIVTWEHLLRDVMGTLGWRPDLLARIEAAYRALTDDVENDVTPA